MRLQFDVTPERAKELDLLMRKCGVESRKDLFNNALTLLEWAIGEVENGKEIASVNEREQKYRILQMPVFRNAQALAMAEAQPVP